MPLTINLRHLEDQTVRLEGELPVEELELETRDPMIKVVKPLGYDLEVQKLEEGLLVEGRLRLPLACECVRCLKPFEYEVELNEYAAHLPLQGEEAVPVNNDCVDLTPLLREDILLEFPQHPLCDPECKGLPSANQPNAGNPASASQAGQPQTDTSAWSELNKLKF